VLDGLLHPHSSIPYVQMSCCIALCTVSLLSRDSCERAFIALLHKIKTMPVVTDPGIHPHHNNSIQSSMLNINSKTFFYLTLSLYDIYIYICVCVCVSKPTRRAYFHRL